ncbi:MAG: restriction endonuclease subunit S [Campylobacterales bacterium]|nr:restriction endonuclease subunit S [Campylobacterales bacterium]
MRALLSFVQSLTFRRRFRMRDKMNVPKLRFREFSGEWEEKKLGEISSKINSGKTPLGGESVYTEEGILFIRSQNVFDNKLSLENSTFIPEQINNTMKNSIVLPKDILLNITGASLGRSCVVPKDFIVGNVNQHVCIVRINKENEPYFIQPIFSSETGQNVFTSLQTGSGREGLNFQSIKTIKLNLPSKLEQQKIASFLTSVDTKIEQLTKKKILLDQYKKGVMQKIFAQEIRFRDDDGSEYPEWIEKKLGEVVKNIGGTALEKHVSPTGKYNFISIGNYTKDGKYIDNGQRIELNEKTKTKLVNKDDLIMVLNDKTSSGDIIGSTILINENDKFIYNQRSERLTCNEKLSPYYAWHYLNSNLFRKKVFLIAQGGTQIYVNFPSVKELKIHMPTLKEQTKIANFLSSLDSKIWHVETQLNSTKQFKKALLQQMFV